MESREIIERLKSLEPALRATGVESLHLFGSHAQGNPHDGSDIDLYAEGTADRRLDLISIAKGQMAIQALFPDTEISYSSRDAIAPLYLPYIEASSVRVF
jgi:uncharacterized protein